MQNKQRKAIFKTVFIILIFSFVISSSGCEPLRKKFVRKKKEDKAKAEIIPVLEPVEYDSKSDRAKEKYQYHYSLWRVWQKELYQSVDEDEQVRVSYLYSEMMGQLDALKECLIPEKKKELENEISQIDRIKKEIERPRAMRNNFLIKKELRLHEKRMRNHFSPSVLGDFTEQKD